MAQGRSYSQRLSLSSFTRGRISVRLGVCRKSQRREGPRVESFVNILVLLTNLLGCRELRVQLEPERKGSGAKTGGETRKASWDQFHYFVWERNAVGVGDSDQ